MDRTVFCVLGGADQVEGRTGSPQEFVRGFRFTLRRQMADSMSRALEQGGLVINTLEPGTRPATLPDSLAPTLRGVPFLFGTLQMGARTLGAVYCDRGLSSRPLLPSGVDGFRHLIQQANITLAQVTASRPAPG